MTQGRRELHTLEECIDLITEKANKGKTHTELQPCISKAIELLQWIFSLKTRSTAFPVRVHVTGSDKKDRFVMKDLRFFLQEKRNDNYFIIEPQLKSAMASYYVPAAKIASLPPYARPNRKNNPNYAVINGETFCKLDLEQMKSHILQSLADRVHDRGYSHLIPVIDELRDESNASKESEHSDVHGSPYTITKNKIENAYRDLRQNGKPAKITMFMEWLEGDAKNNKEQLPENAKETVRYMIKNWDSNE